MFHPSILRTYVEYRTGQQLPAIDACTYAAQFHEVSCYDLAQFLVTVGIDADRLSLLS